MESSSHSVPDGSATGRYSGCSEEGVFDIARVRTARPPPREAEAPRVL